MKIETVMKLKAYQNIQLKCTFFLYWTLIFMQGKQAFFATALSLLQLNENVKSVKKQII
jgi:hypothetical protein